MLCAISGEPPKEPVASRKSGNVYEKRLIEAYVTENGTEPTTGEALSIEDLVNLKSPATVRPRPPTLTSIPALLSVFQEEWDSLALQTYTLQQNLNQTRQELSTALYQNDAAQRVIARLLRERDDARQALARIDVGRASTNGDAMQVDSAPLPEAIQQTIDNTQQSLMKTRRKRPVPEDWATPEAISSYAPKSSSEPLYPGGKIFAVHESGDAALVSGSDGSASIYSLSQNKPLLSLSTGSGTATAGTWAGKKAVLATSSGAVVVFEDNQQVASFAVHAGSVNAVATHPSGSILASVGEDKTYILYDLESNKVLTQIQSDSGLTSAQFHPDGHLLAAGGNDGQIKIFEVKSGAQAATFNLGGPVKAVVFSENGTWLAGVAQGSSSISIWDLRKSAEIKTLETGSAINSISWDYTGQFLAAAGAGGITVEAYSKAAKEWSGILSSAVPSTRVAWGKQAQSLIAVDDSGKVVTWSG
ncbi:hypothetical protein PV10_04514 [Exophiala mesophila]|uniref:Pre-mRNA-processing factor 19 n=1 Tax=Exophiala mesophila TaxID=212818 RepID=A0A0D2A2I9_EXOME|nr:uncharacterized protein PV10_04514 [Exophiala mesophila]KIV93288.1 hypothetical protein PV10_04514 [Exophiala mesophila]